MELPQELIDSIIDAVVDDLELAQDPWAINNTPDVLETLKSCALVTSAFVHPCQLYIFHGITLSDDAHIPPLKFYTLLVERPHLASYVRALYFEYAFAAAEQNVELVRHILASLTDLARLDVYPDTESQGIPWQTFPEPVRTAFTSAFALLYLHHITLWYFSFEDALELETLLAESTSLQTLVLRSIEFWGTERTETLKLPAKQTPSRVVLDSLELYFMDTAQLQALLDSFTTVDITHLRSLYLHNSSMNSLLRVNASTIERVKICAYYPDLYLEQQVDPEALAGAHHLQALDLQLPFLPSLNKVLRIFGSLGHLTRLQTISVTVSQKTDQDDWQELDRLLGVLGDLPALAEVNIFSGSEWDKPHPESLLRAWMPTLAGQDVLRIHDVVPDFSV